MGTFRVIYFCVLRIYPQILQKSQVALWSSPTLRSGLLLSSASQQKLFDRSKLKAFISELTLGVLAFADKGSTADLKRRLSEHNSGQNFSIAPHAPLKLIYYEAYILKSDAESREKYLKTSMGMRVIKKQLANYL